MQIRWPVLTVTRLMACPRRTIGGRVICLGPPLNHRFTGVPGETPVDRQINVLVRVSYR